MASTHPFLFVFLLILPQLALGGQGPPALTEIPLYQDLRQCAQSYVFNWCCTVDVYEALGCPSPPVDECLCREDLRGIGSSFLSKSVNSACSTNGLDLSNALSVWDIYCSREGMEPSLSVETATTTANNEQPSAPPISSPGASPSVITKTVSMPESTARTVSVPTSNPPAVTVTTQVEVGSTQTAGASGLVLQASGIQAIMGVFFAGVFSVALSRVIVDGGIL